MSLFWGSSNAKFDEDVDKATSEDLPLGGENLELNFEISDSIRSKTVPAKDAMRSIKRRLNHKNPNVQLLALTLTDTCIKNSGDHFLVEVASREFLDNLVSIVKVPNPNPDVKQKILKFIQDWAIAFESRPTLTYVGEVYKTLRKEGFTFPPKDAAVTSAAMIDSLTPPEWVDSDVCLRCRTPFSFTNRKHHCRSCGLVFDQQCSSKVLPLPHLGIHQPVRVCDSCFVKLGKAKTAPNGDDKSVASAHKTHHHHRSSSKAQSQPAKAKSGRELDDEELQRAIQLSLEEAGMVHGPRNPNYVPQNEISEPPLVESNGLGPEADDDPDLRAAIEASLREANAPRASAPAVDEPESSYGHAAIEVPSNAVTLPNYDLDDRESDAIMTFSQTVEAASSRGARDFVRHPEVGDLYSRTERIQPKLQRSLDDAGRREVLLSEMNQKLSEAAKLYDQLLSAHVSSPIRVASPAQPYAPPAATYYTPPQQQWNHQSIKHGPYQAPVPSQPIAQPDSYSYGPSTSAVYNSPNPISYAAASPPPLSSSPIAYQPLVAPQTVTSPPPFPQQAQAAPIAVQPPPQQPQVWQQPQPTQPQLSSSPAAYASPPIAAQQPQSYAPQVQSQPQYQPPVQQAPPSLPAFPAVPNEPLPPIQYASPPQEQKEAMLISFD